MTERNWEPHWEHKRLKFGDRFVYFVGRLGEDSAIVWSETKFVASKFRDGWTVPHRELEMLPFESLREAHE